MAYSSVAILALLVHLIINYDVLKPYDKTKSPASFKSYRHFLFGIMTFYLTDALWGVLYEAKWLIPIYLDTVIYYLAMAISVFLWTRYVIEYLNEKNIFIKLSSLIGWVYIVFDCACLIINLFVPVKFYFDEEIIYHAGITRYVSLIIQILMFFITAIYVYTVAAKLKGKERHHHRTVGAFGIAMTIFVIIQTIYPLLPLYSIGYLLGTCLLHTFVLEDEKEQHRHELEEHIYLENIQKMQLGSARKLAYTDALTGVKNKLAYSEAVVDIEDSLASGTLTDVGIVVFDLNGLKTINDTKGHEAGDRYIQDSCHIICDTFKHSPVYRIGGDEFVAILRGEDYDNRHILMGIFNQIIEKNLKNGEVVIASGLEEYHFDEDDSLTKVFERADKKMYERKRLLKEMKV